MLKQVNVYVYTCIVLFILSKSYYSISTNMSFSKMYFFGIHVCMRNIIHSYGPITIGLSFDVILQHDKQSSKVSTHIFRK